jgi:endonuclease/exonuclease/phosphatase (EEP) superfamily protein YafD
MSLRILTMNLYNGAVDPVGLAAVLEQSAPDIAAVQELTDSSARVLRDWASHCLLDPQDDITGMGIAARVPFEACRPEFPHRDPIIGSFDARPWGLGTVELINAHLTNPIALPIGASRRLRQGEADALEKLLSNRHASTARVLVGDLNSSPAWPLYRRLASLATDGAVQAGTAKRTWSYYPWSPRMLRIDHVFLQGAVRCVATRLVKIRGADHRGLLIDLEPDPSVD